MGSLRNIDVVKNNILFLLRLNMIKSSSGLLFGARQQRQSVLFASRHYFHQRNSRDKLKSLRKVDT
jgi:hypothetical protein